MSYAAEGFADDRFLVLDLPFVTNVLPMTTSGCLVIRAVGLLAVWRRFQDFDDPCGRVVLLLRDDLHFENIPWRAPRHKHDALICTRKTESSVYQLLNGD